MVKRNLVKANVTGSQLLALDRDTADEHSHFSTLLEDPFIAQHAGLLHATASATPTQPRSRIIFLLEEVLETADYEVALKAPMFQYSLVNLWVSDLQRPMNWFVGL